MNEDNNMFNNYDIGVNKPQTEKARYNDMPKVGDEITTFCGYCEDFVTGRVIESVEKVYDFGKIAKYNKLDFVCTRCGSFLYDDLVEEVNNQRKSIIE